MYTCCCSLLPMASPSLPDICYAQSPCSISPSHSLNHTVSISSLHGNMTHMQVASYPCACQCHISCSLDQHVQLANTHTSAHQLLSILATLDCCHGSLHSILTTLTLNAHHSFNCPCAFHYNPSDTNVHCCVPQTYTIDADNFQVCLSEQDDTSQSHVHACKGHKRPAYCYISSLLRLTTMLIVICLQRPTVCECDR